MRKGYAVPIILVALFLLVIGVFIFVLLGTDTLNRGLLANQELDKQIYDLEKQRLLDRNDDFNNLVDESCNNNNPSDVASQTGSTYNGSYFVFNNYAFDCDGVDQANDASCSSSFSC